MQIAQHYADRDYEEQEKLLEALEGKMPVIFWGSSFLGIWIPSSMRFFYGCPNECKPRKAYLISLKWTSNFLKFSIQKSRCNLQEVLSPQLLSRWKASKLVRLLSYGIVLSRDNINCSKNFKNHRLLLSNRKYFVGNKQLPATFSNDIKSKIWIQVMQ